MRWLWYVGPVVIAIVYLWTALLPTRRDRWRKAELRRWVADMLGPLPLGRPREPVYRRPGAAEDGSLAGATQSRFLGRLPASFEPMADEAGLGSIVDIVTLVPKLAYLNVRSANRQIGSNQQTVVAKLAKPAPSMVVRPLPLVEGRRQENRGITIAGDTKFNDQYMVEGTDAAQITKWLNAPIREALLELPDAWLRTDGRMMALTVYGDADADRLDELVAAADAIFAERGTAKAPSLLGDEQLALPNAKGRGAATARARREGREAQALDAAPVASRFWALAIDVLLYAAAVALLIGVISLREEGLEGLLKPAMTDEFDGPWQGGWNTKGVGALVMAEAVLVGLFIGQTFFSAQQGRTLGMWLMGARVVRLDGTPVEFFRGVLLRTWLLAMVPLALAGVLTRPFRAGAYFAHLLDTKVLLAAAAMVVLDAVVLLVSSGGGALHDSLAGTRVVVAPRASLDLLRG
jgi:uncharacterized RDD family membrane protein YckC